jgi:hydrogenase expression/formation protein HypD
VMGYWEYLPIAHQYRVPIVVTGFEPVDLLQGMMMTVRMLESGQTEVQNAYSRLVTEAGNIPAQRVINDVFETCDRQWRGIGPIPASGWKLRSEYQEFDAETKFQVTGIHTQESPNCISGTILQGLKKPYECKAFGTLCTPVKPLGATMVSSEGACAAYYRYWKND